MHIKSVEIVGFMGKPETVSHVFNADLNIATGINGSGKTTLLKLIWYTISGNVQHALEEIEFSRLTVDTTEYKVVLHKIAANTCRAEVEDTEGSYVFDDYHGDDEDPDHIVDARDQLNSYTAEKAGTVFFPTFRRIEGGFTIKTRNQASTRRSGQALFNAPRTKSDLEDAVLAVSRRLSARGHTFVTSISTLDIVELLLRQYTEMSENANAKQQKVSQDIIHKIKEFRRDVDIGSPSYDVVNDTADSVLDSIRITIENMEKERKTIMAPLEAVQNLGAKIFQHAGISLGSRVSFGDAANAVNSDSLSAGEKQMLSFICYNAFNDNAIIFIDEPELSLHVDWQRLLFPMLLRQGKNNQFIVATHSPFIYSQFPDKEMRLSPVRGDALTDSNR